MVLTGEAGGVSKELAVGDFILRVLVLPGRLLVGQDLERGELWEEGVDSVVEVEAALLDQLHDRDADVELRG